MLVNNAGWGSAGVQFEDVTYGKSSCAAEIQPGLHALTWGLCAQSTIVSAPHPRCADLSTEVTSPPLTLTY